MGIYPVDNVSRTEFQMIETVIKLFILKDQHRQYQPSSSPDTLGTSPTRPSRARSTCTPRSKSPATRDPISPLRHHGPLTPVPM